MTDPHPLVDLPLAIPFDRIGPEHVVPDVRLLLERARSALEDVRTPRDAPSWDQTLGALETALTPVSEAWTVVTHLMAVDHSEALVAAHGEVLPEVTDFFSDLYLDADLYRAVRTFADTTPRDTLTAVQRRHLDRTLDAFVRHGADLGAEDKARFKAIATELAELTTTFATNVVEETAAWDLVVTDEARLDGLPDAAVASARKAAQTAGHDVGWRFTQQMPSVLAVLTHATDRDLREAVWRGRSRRCVEGERANGPLISRIVALRAEQAGLLGFDDFSDYVLADRMASDGATAQAFIEDLERRARPSFEQETTELAAFATDTLGLGSLQPWDVGFAAEKLRKARFDLDQEALRPYFAFDRVLSGMFELVQRLYGITVRPTTLPTWHEDVETYEVVDADGTVLGAFHADFFPRPTKRGGAWMNPLQTGRPTAPGGRPHLGLICGNLTPPGDDTPALLTHREVETLFHEFGHLLHHLLTTVEIPSRAGTNVAWDFVELPSQIMENWTWERDALDLIAAHHETGERLPDDLFDRMRAARTFRSGSFVMRQLSFGLLDLALHRQWDGEGDPMAFVAPILDRCAPAPSPEGHSMLPAFLHLFSSSVGYAAGYYSYMWAAVLDADAFTRFLERGLFDPATGRAFRDTILSQGDAAPPDDLFRAFMGRDPTPDALLARLGLAA